MVDINLLGDDREQNEGSENDDNFSNTYDADGEEFTTEPPYPDPDMDQNIYDKSYTKSGSKKTIFAVVALIVFAAVIVYIYLPYTSKDESQLTDSADTEVVESEKPLVDIPPEMNIAEEPTVEVPVFIKEMINSTRHGIRTVETILATIPRDMNFTMIQYSDGNFLAEFLGKSANNISNLKNQLQQELSSGNVRELSRDKRNIMGYTYQQTLLNGSFSDVGIGVAKPPIYWESDKVKAEFTEYCKQFGISLKQFEINNEIRTTDYKKIPVIFRAIGNKDSALNFLNKLLEENINVNLSKIAFIDRNFGGSKIILVLNMEIYHPI